MGMATSYTDSNNVVDYWWYSTGTSTYCDYYHEALYVSNKKKVQVQDKKCDPYITWPVPRYWWYIDIEYIVPVVRKLPAYEIRAPPNIIFAVLLCKRPLNSGLFNIKIL